MILGISNIDVVNRSVEFILLAIRIRKWTGLRLKKRLL